LPRLASFPSSLCLDLCLIDRQVSGQRVLRLLPISGGIFSGGFLEEMPAITRDALSLAFRKHLSPAERQLFNEQAALKHGEASRVLHLCIFKAEDEPMWAAEGWRGIDGGTFGSDGGGSRSASSSYNKRKIDITAQSPLHHRPGVSLDGTPRMKSRRDMKREISSKSFSTAAPRSSARFFENDDDDKKKKTTKTTTGTIRV
jgi:hypothetical protein